IDPALLLAPARHQSPDTGLARPTPREEETHLAVDPQVGLPRRASLAVPPPAPAAASPLPGRPAPALSPVTVAAAAPAEAEPLVSPLAQARCEWESPRAAAPAPGPAREPSAPLSGPAPLVLRLGVLAVSWPEAVRREIDQLNLAEAHVALPLDLVAQGLKRGRLVFSWQTLRTWIQPTPVPALSAHDALELELALKVVAPLFLARQRDANKPRPKLEVASEIPDLFAGILQPAPAACPPPARNGDTHPDMAPEALRPASPAPKPNAAAVAQGATPQQLVNRATQIQGVEGALVALRDGLLVASRFPAHLNADNIAAFLPQIFSRLGQYTQELHMGDLNALEFLVGKVPWKVFRLNEVFFVAFGREGEPLPSAPLASLATELGQSR
ncbi:MAG TPA: roadblock/LC7 domain-containing protein, partial [Bacillota bacterium]|nr:roadblock/LC7 domain-containing protein [Bacillota bacterium]